VPAPDQDSIEPAPQPNIIFILTDDQSLGSFTPASMPRTHRLLADRGTVFRKALVPTPLCCPSRAAFSTGQYGHNNGVLRNSYAALNENDNLLPVWLQRAGYRTAHVGRFYNGYERTGRELEVAPGWDIWRSALNPRGYYDYALTTNKGTQSFGTESEEYLTTNLNRVAAAIVRRQTARRAPLFLQLDHLAPHVGRGDPGGRCDEAAVPAFADSTAYLDEPLPKSPSYNEADLSDKPSFMQELPLIEAEAEAEITRQYGCAMASLLEVDRGVAAIHKALAAADALEDTVVIFSSDNGFEFGEHRLAPVKLYPYEESIRVPLVIRLPKGVEQEPATGLPVANIDLAPTLLELAGARSCNREGCVRMDGRSLLPTMLGEPDISPDRAIALELDAPISPEGLVCRYSGLWSRQFTYVEHSSARPSEEVPCEPVTDTELYDHAADPFQLENLTPPGVAAADVVPPELLTRQDRLAICSGIKGRDRRLEGTPYCE